MPSPSEIRHVQKHAELLYSQADVEAALDTLATSITQQLADQNPLLLCVLNGGIMTTGALAMRLPFPLQLDSIIASRYQNQTTGSQRIDWRLEPRTPLAGRTVLIVDDILDEGVTLAAIQDYCARQGASAIFSAVLIDKQLNQPKPAQADFVALHTENRYLFGWGMDYKGYLRNAAGIFACKDI